MTAHLATNQSHQSSSRYFNVANNNAKKNYIYSRPVHLQQQKFMDASVSKEQLVDASFGNSEPTGSDVKPFQQEYLNAMQQRTFAHKLNQKQESISPTTTMGTTIGVPS